MLGPDIVVPIGFFTMILGLVVGTPVARAYARRVSAAPPPAALPPAEVIARLDRIEQAVEAMATEVERIADGQRFVTRLLSETRSPQALQGSSGDGSARLAAPGAPDAVRHT